VTGSQRRFLEIFSVVEEFVKRRDEFLKNLMDEKELKRYFVNSNLAIVVLTVIYGATMGTYPGGLQILYDAVKIPMLLLISLYLTAPSYYVLCSILGGKRTVLQMVVLLLSGFTVMSTVLLALVPVNLFFILTTADTTFTSYAFVVLLNIGIFSLAGFFALAHLVIGFKKMYQEANWTPAFLAGSLILMFVGTQLAWILRPYFHYDPQFIRPVERNFYIALIELIVRLLRGIY